MCLTLGSPGRRLALLLTLLPLAACDFPIPPGGMGSAPTVAPDLSDGTRARGTLTDSDEQRPSGQRRDNIATVTVPPDGRLEVVMESTEFDTYLLVEMVGTDQSVTNDDFNGSRERSVIVQPNPTDGPVQALIVASAFGSGGRGSYEVRYAVRAAPPPVDGDELALGTTSGQITASTKEVPLTASEEPRRARAYTVRLRQGETVTFRMESSAFDTYLKIDRNGTYQARNDDFEGSRAVSQITFTPRVSGDYTLYAGTYTATGAGAFTLTYTLGAAPASPPAAPRPTGLGPNASTVQGTLTDDDARPALVASGDTRLADAYDIELDAGQTLVVVMESTVFDTYLKLLRGDTFLARNDDDGSIQRSTIRYTATESGTHRVLAGTFHERGRGAYTLRYSIE